MCAVRPLPGAAGVAEAAEAEVDAPHNGAASRKSQKRKCAAAGAAEASPRCGAVVAARGPGPRVVDAAPRRRAVDAPRAADEGLEKICELWPPRARGPRGCDGLLREPVRPAGGAPNASEHLRRRIDAAVRQRRRLVIALLGDSVIAGHDNFYNQTLAPLLLELLGPPLEASGAALVVENFAVGSVGEFPYTAACLAQRLGDLRPDVVTWKWELCVRPRRKSSSLRTPIPAVAASTECPRRGRGAAATRLRGRPPRTTSWPRHHLDPPSRKTSTEEHVNPQV